MKNKIIRFPIKKRKMVENKNIVTCMVSDRWIEFPEKSIGASFWTIYLLRSKRVKNTYTQTFSRQ